MIDPLFPMRHPCPCGSGKRFKNCCDGLIQINVQGIKRHEHSHPGYIEALIKHCDEKINHASSNG